MKLLGTLAAAAAALALAATATASTHYSPRVLSDAHLGSTPAELIAQQEHSRHVLAFFAKHGWMVASHHRACGPTTKDRGVPWAKTCKRARSQVRLHRWLLDVTERRMFDPQVVRAWVLRYHPCLDQIIRLEDGSYEPTRSYGGYGDTSVAYGLPQATPGTKMAWIGPDWRTNPYTQLKWMIWYVNRKFGGECQAAYSRIHSHMY